MSPTLLAWGTATTPVTAGKRLKTAFDAVPVPVEVDRLDLVGVCIAARDGAVCVSWWSWSSPAKAGNSCRWFAYLKCRSAEDHIAGCRGSCRPIESDAVLLTGVGQPGNLPGGETTTAVDALPVPEALTASILVGKGASRV